MPYNNSTIIHQLINFQQTIPQKLAYTFLTEDSKVSISYGELAQKVVRLGSYLSQRFPANSKAVLLLQPGLEYIISFLGCLAAGIIAVPAYPPRNKHHTQRLIAVINDAKAKLVVTTSKVAQQHGFDDYTVLEIDSIDTNEIHSNELPELSENQLAFLQYTSGSTGTPKGVMVSHANIVANAKLIRRLFNRDAFKLCSWLPPYHDMGLIGGLLYPLYHGGESVLMSPITFLKNPFFWLKTISDYKIDVSPAPNFAYELCANTITEEEKKQLDLSSWFIALNGSEPVQEKTMTQFINAFSVCGFKPEYFYPSYGMAETTLMVSGKRSEEKTVTLYVDKKEFLSHKITITEPNEQSIGLISCGHVDPLHDIKIINPETKQTLPAYEVGEIVISGEIVTQGYWEKPELTEQQFHFTLPNSDKDFFRTGDLGFLDANGELFITGRLKDLIIIRGQNIYPQDIESLASKSHEGLITNGAAAFTIDIGDQAELIIVLEVHRSIKEYDSVFDAILNECAKELPFMPARLVLIRQASLFKTSSGKVQRSLCKNALLTNQLIVIAEWQRNSFASVPSQIASHPSDLQLWMRQWLAKRLAITEQQINIHCNFAYYGIDSLLAAQFCAACEQKVQQKINPSLLWSYTTIEQFANYLSGLAKIEHPIKEASVNPSQFEPIAVIGMSCRFPGDANTPDTFWQLLSSSKDGVTPISAERHNLYTYDKSTSEKMNHKKGGFTENIDQFDSNLFHINHEEAVAMDPQHRLLLELTWEALENALIDPLSLYDTDTGVFVGISSNDYSHLDTGSRSYYGLGNAHSAAAGRIAYFLGTHGQTLAIDTACSSSLVAVFNACQNLQNNLCTLSIVGGVNVILDPILDESFANAGMLSPSGACHTFDAEADGYVRGEGGGVVLLKRLSDAERDGNKILAVIKGAFVNSDGHSNGITAPNPLAQEALIKNTIKLAGLRPDEIDYIEAHGTGTRLGDPIEFNALKTVFATGSRKKPLSIGAVKSSIGHLEAAAGMAGLIKTILMLQHQQIPANLHFKHPNPLIELDTIPSHVPTQLEP